MLSAAGMISEGVKRPGGCYLMAYLGDMAIGVVGIEVRVDAALIRSLTVAEAMRGRGIGAALVAAARLAAHTRGARTLYAVVPEGEAAGYFRRFGFAPVSLEQALGALAGTFAEHLRQRPAESELRALALDIANDGVINR